MSMNATLVFEEIVYVTKGTGINPFAAIAKILYSQIYPAYPSSFSFQIYITLAIMAVQLMMFLVSLGIRAYGGSEFWVVRLLKTHRGTYIAPNFSVTWQLSMFALLIAFYPYGFAIIHHITGNPYPRYLCWVFLIWLGVFFAAWIAMWSLSVIDTLPRSVDPNSPRQNTFFTSPLFLNVAFPSSLFIVSAAVITVSVLCSNKYDILIDAFSQAVQEALVLAAQYDSVDSPEALLALERLIPVAQFGFDSFASFLPNFRAVWCVWGASTALLCIAFVTLFTRQYHRLTSTFKETQLNLQHGSSLQPSASVFPVNQQQLSVKAALRNLYLTSSIAVSICALFFAIVTFMAVRTQFTATNIMALQIAYLFGFWGTAICGTIGSTLMLLQALRIKSPLYAGSGSGGVGTDTEPSHGLSFKRSHHTGVQRGNTAVRVDIEMLVDENEREEEAKEMGKKGVYELSLRGGDSEK